MNKHIIQKRHRKRMLKKLKRPHKIGKGERAYKYGNVTIYIGGDLYE